MYSSFNHLTQLAAVLAEAPIAALLFTKEDMLYCKCCVGITSEQIELYNDVITPSLLKTEDYDCILNIHADEKWNTLKQSTEFFKIKSYHSYRIKSKGGKPLGLLVVLKHEEKELKLSQINALRLLSLQVVKLLDLQEKNKSLKKCQKQINKNTKKVDDFASMAAHDLKAPLRNIKSFLELIKSENTWDAENASYFDYIDKSIAKMNALINGLLDYAKTKENNECTEIVKLDDLVLNAFQDGSQNLDLSSVSLIKEPLPDIYSNKMQLSVVIQNLMSNAIKYHKHHPIEIKVIYNTNNNYHILEISDNGIGIEDQYYNEIFKPFKRLHTQSEFEGSGLGLATCKKIMRNLKGSISVSSKLGQGSIFTIKLPIN